MEKICEEYGLLRNNKGVIRVPFLVKGKIVVPPEIGTEQIKAAFKDTDRDTTYLKLPMAQLIREPVIDRKTLKYTGEYIYQVLPPISGGELIENDIDKLVQGPYALSVKDILDYLSSISAILCKNQKLVEKGREICRLTTEYPDAFLRGLTCQGSCGEWISSVMLIQAKRLR